MACSDYFDSFWRCEFRQPLITKPKLLKRASARTARISTLKITIENMPASAFMIVLLLPVLVIVCGAGINADALTADMTTSGNAAATAKTTAATSSSSCRSARALYASLGNNVRFCKSVSSSTTCCTEEMEFKLASKARQTFDSTVARRMAFVRHALSEMTFAFDSAFLRVLEYGRTHLDQMFQRTYGAMYSQNSHFFTGLFDELINFYRGYTEQSFELILPESSASSIAALPMNSTNGRNNDTKSDIEQTMQRFFTRIYVKMFELMNAQYKFDERYKKCVEQNMQLVRPFDDLPTSMGATMRRAFVAARTMAAALSIGRDVMQAASQVTPSSQCTAALTRLTHCQLCSAISSGQGDSGRGSLPPKSANSSVKNTGRRNQPIRGAHKYEAKPCNNFCLNVLKGCLAHHAELDRHWNNFIGALGMLAESLQSSYNIENVIQPLDMRISESIMIYQGRGPDVTKILFERCGAPPTAAAATSTTPKSSRPAIASRKIKRATAVDEAATSESSNLQRRSANADAMLYRYERLHYTPTLPRTTDGQFQSTAQQVVSNPIVSPVEVSFEQLLKNMQQKIVSFAGFWNRLPKSVCRDRVFAPNDPSSTLNSGEDEDDEDIDEEELANMGKCWNGTDVGAYRPAVVGDGLRAQLNNPEFEREGEQQISSFIRYQQAMLEKMTEKLRTAYNGANVHWDDLTHNMPAAPNGLRTVPHVLRPSVYESYSPTTDQETVLYAMPFKNKASSTNRSLDIVDDMNVDASLTSRIGHYPAHPYYGSNSNGWITDGTHTDETSSVFEGIEGSGRGMDENADDNDDDDEDEEDDDDDDENLGITATILPKLEPSQTMPPPPPPSQPVPPPKVQPTDNNVDVSGGKRQKMHPSSDADDEVTKVGLGNAKKEKEFVQNSSGSLAASALLMLICSSGVTISLMVRLAAISRRFFHWCCSRHETRRCSLATVLDKTNKLMQIVPMDSARSYDTRCSKAVLTGERSLVGRFSLASVGESKSSQQYDCPCCEVKLLLQPSSKTLNINQRILTSPHFGSGSLFETRRRRSQPP